MVRLPVPGSDVNQWGVILNDFLNVIHNPDGTLKSGTINSSQLISSSVTNTILADNSVTNAKLDTATQSVISSVASKYTQPAAGIPAADLTSAVQASLGKADSALQAAPVTTVNSKTGDVVLTAADIGAPTMLSALNDVNTSGATTNQVLSFDSATGKWSASTVTSTTVNDASNTGKGIIQLSGDLGGSNDPTLPTISAGAITDAKVATNAAIAQAKINNLTTDLSAKAPIASPTFTGTVTIPTPTNNTDAATKNYVDTTVTSAVTTATTPDAATTTKGIVQLAGDLAGTAASPTVPGLTTKENTIASGTTAQYYRGDKSWQTLDKTAVGLNNVDNTADINKPVSTATQTVLNTEVTDRTNADTTLQNNINAEATARANADASVIPTGSIIVTAGSSAPTGWLLCNGALVSRSTYTILFATIGSTYGAGDGSTTFGLPNLLGKVIAGVDAAQTEFNTLGKTGGEKTHIMLITEMPSHNHIQDPHTHTQNSHNHIQDIHNHTQNSHNHIQDPHTHFYYRPQYETVQVQSGTGALNMWGGPASATWTTSGTTPANQVATATNIATTATNQVATATNIATTATNQTAGGGGAHNNLQPYASMNYIIRF